MAKYLKDILGEDFMSEVYTPFPDDEKRFYQKHGIELGKEGEPPIKFSRFENMYSEKGKDNADDLFTGATKMYDREAHRQGYNPGKDVEHYEEYVVDEAHTKMQAKQAAVYHDTRRDELVAGADRILDKAMDQTDKTKQTALLKARDELVRRSQQHDNASRIARKLSESMSPLTNRNEK